MILGSLSFPWIHNQILCVGVKFRSLNEVSKIQKHLQISYQAKEEFPGHCGEFPGVIHSWFHADFSFQDNNPSLVH